MKTCGNCGHQNGNNENACTWCGTALTPATPKSKSSRKGKKPNQHLQRNRISKQTRPARLGQLGQIARAGAKAIAKSLALSLVVLGPGFALLIMGMVVPGMIWLFLGSFGLMAWSYRKPWRLGLIPCLVPPVAASASYIIQLVLFGSVAPPPVLILPAVALGAAIGYWRARSHVVRRDESGSVIAERTLEYLLVWVATYGATQALGFLATNTYAVRAGLVSGAFSTAMLFVVSLVVWRQFRMLQTSTIAILAGFLTLNLAQDALAQSPLCSPIQQEMASRIESTISRNFPGLATSDKGVRYLGNESDFCLIEYRFYGGEAGGSISFKVRQTHDRLDQHRNAVNIYEMNEISLPGFDAAFFRSRFGGAEGTYLCHGELSAINGSTHILASVDVEYYEEGICVPGQPNSILVELTPDIANALNGRPQPEQVLGATGGLGGNSTPPTPPDPPSDISEQAVAIGVAVSIILIAAGVAVNVAQAVAAAIANALQAGVEFTSAEIQNAIANALLGKLPDPETPAPETPQPPPRIRIPGGTQFETNDEGEYWGPDKKGDWRWLSEKDARTAARTLWEKESGHNAKRQEHDRLTEEMRERSRQEIAERAARERAEEERENLRRRAETAELERIEKAAARVGDIDILTRTGAERVFRQDGSVDTEYLDRVHKTLRDRIGRDVAVPDSTLEDKGLTGIAWETVDGALEDGTNSFVARVGFGVVSGGASEAVFQGRGVWNAVKKAAEDAEDRGVTLSEAEVAAIVAGKFVKDNMPVNTLDALNRMRKGEVVSLSEIAISLIADGFSTLEVAEALKIDPKDVLSKLGRKVLSDEGLKMAQSARAQVSNATDRVVKSAQHLNGRANDAFDSALEGLRLRARQSRMGVDHASVRFENNRLTAKTEDILEGLQGNRSPAMIEADAAFEAGRARGRQRIEGLASSIDDLNRARASGTATPDGLAGLERKLRDDVMRIQGDKHAMNEMNQLPKGADGTNGTIAEFNGQMKRIYDQADEAMVKRLAEEYGVRPEDIQTVNVSNEPGKAGTRVDPGAPARDHTGQASSWKGDGSIENSRAARSEPGTIDGPETGRQPAPDPSEVRGDKVSFDRDLTMRVRTVIDGRVVYRDIPSSTTARIYNEEFFKAATGKTLKVERGAGYLDVSPDGQRALGNSIDFKDRHMSANDYSRDIMDIDDPDVFATRADQATTDRLNPEAYGTGQADLDTATKDSFRGRDLTDSAGTAKTIEYKVDHWANEADRLREMARAADDPVVMHRLMEQSGAHLHEGQRQLIKQYGNMALKRTDAMQGLGNAPKAMIPLDLAERIGVLKRTELPPGPKRLTPAAAEEALNKMGTSTRDVSRQLSAYVEGLEKLRTRQPQARTATVFQGWQDDFKTQPEGGVN